MKNLLLITPALFLMACGGETKPEIEEVENVIEDVVEQVVEEVIEETVPECPELSSVPEIQEYLKGKSWETTEKHESGMYIVIDNPGEGDERPTLMDEVTIFYQGFLLDGKRFDGTIDMPATFPLMNLIQGWQIGIPMFGKGGQGKLIIPSDLAYGDRNTGDIPGGSTLLFEIKLVDWAPAM